MLAVQRVDAWPDLRLRMPAEMASLSACRDALGDWLDGAGTDHEQAVALLHAVGELVANAIEHAFVDGTGVFTLRATLTPDGYAHMTVADQGRWREPVRPSDRGRGLALATQLVNSLHIGHTDRGTVATIRHRLMRPARMLAGRPDGPDRGTVHRPADTPLLMVLDHAGTDSGRVRVDGPVDAGTATQLQHELMRRTRGGALPLFVDLTGVTHLASAGVATLHRLVDRHRRQHAALTLYAEPGSPAQHIMTLVALPHTSSLAKTEDQ
jgi:anti-sigma regulatory factor (Ser/Thr protein kinase)/anti-anti-sigma regulatory factor